MTECPGRTRPFILYPRQNSLEVRRCVLANFGRIKYDLPFLQALCVEIPVTRIRHLRTNRRIAAMSEDVRVSKLSGPFDSLRGALREQPDLRPSARRPRSSAEPAPELSAGPFPRAASDGKGVTIAVIDTGVTAHYDLTRPVNRILAFKDFVHGRTYPYDDDGHGTHVCGIAAGNGFISAKHCGTAPEASLVVLKALDKEGNGNASDILAAMQWIYDHRRRYNIRVVNLSLGVPPTGDLRTDPLVLGANALAEAGICVVAAAGNSGPSRSSISSPGISPLVLTVGSCDARMRVAAFSSRGPSPFAAVKPDLVAPGVDVISLAAQSVRGYRAQSGTSMSAPYVAGLAACYCGCHPDARPAQIRRALMGMARPLDDASRYAQGRGLLTGPVCLDFQPRFMW